jgi:hypothetical protein
MDETTARAVVEQMTRFSNQLHEVAAELTRECGPNAAAAYELSVTAIVGEMVARVLAPIWSSFPVTVPKGPVTQDGYDHRTFNVSVRAARAAIAGVDEAERTLEEVRSLVAQKIASGGERRDLEAAIEKIRGRLGETREMLKSDIEFAPN